MHAEANAIISAARNNMIDAELYLVGLGADRSGYVPNANSCSMCKRLIINAGIVRVYIRDDKEHYRTIDVEDWVRRMNP